MSIVDIPERLNAASFLIDRHLDEGRTNQPALLCGERVISYGELHENVNRFGNLLRAWDIRMEERVAILLPDIPEFAYAFFGTMKTGSVATPFNTLLSPAEYEYLLNDSRARLLVVHAALLEPLLPILGKLKYLKHIVVFGKDVQNHPRLEELLQNLSPDLQAADTGRDDSAFWLYSSGTTGFLKGVMHRHQDMIVAADQYAVQTLGVRESDLSFSVAKLFFAYGLGNGLYFPLRVGGTSVLVPEKPMPDTVFGIIDQYQPTLFYSVPTSYAALLQTAEKEERASLGRVRLCVSAGEPLPKPIFDQWKERFGVEIVDGIGSTEALHIFISNRPGEAKGGSTGRIVPGYDARIVDEKGGNLPPGEIGTLLIRGESITTGYWNKLDATRKTLLGEWIDTHDKFRVDEEGFYYYAGRGDDMLKVGGQWVSPTDLEAVLQQHSAVLESGVVGVTDQEGLTNPTAYVVCKEGFTPSPELALELQAFVRENTASHRYSCRIEFINELPKTATGKIRRFKLREKNGGQGAASSPAQASVQPILRPATGSEEAPVIVAGSELEAPTDDTTTAAGTAATVAVTAKTITDFVAKLRTIGDVSEQRDRLGAYMQSQLAIVLALDDAQSIDPEIGFFDLGVDSVAAVAFANHLEIALGCPLPATLMFKYASLAEFTDYIAEEVLELESSTSSKSSPNPDGASAVSEDDLAEINQLSEDDVEALITHALRPQWSIPP